MALTAVCSINKLGSHCSVFGMLSEIWSLRLRSSSGIHWCCVSQLPYHCSFRIRWHRSRFTFSLSFFPLEINVLGLNMSRILVMQPVCFQTMSTQAHTHQNTHMHLTCLTKILFSLSGNHYKLVWQECTLWTGIVLHLMCYCVNTVIIWCPQITYSSSHMHRFCPYVYNSFSRLNC